MGNRLKRVDSAEGTTTYVYDENDRLLESTANGVVTTYQYDDNGNLTSQTANGETTAYTWDDRNRLVSSTTADGDVVTYEYDDENIRVSSTVNGVKTTYLVDSNRPYAQVLEEYEDDNLKVRYVHGLDLISVERDGEVSVYLVDGLGSTRVLTDLDGEVVATYSYDAFGELLDSTGEVENDYLFAGEQFDGELEQYYLRQRFYDAGVGRFTRRDTYEGRIGEPVTLHKYLYGNANPVNFTDPSGLYSVAEANAATSIANILNDIQLDFGLSFVDRLLSEGTNEDNEEESILDVLSDISLSALPMVGAVFGSIIGRKLLFAFGKAGGNNHNIRRSNDMLRQLESIGLHDNKENRAYVAQHLLSVYWDTTNIKENQGRNRVVKESLLAGPRGFLKVESIWDVSNQKLVTVVLKRGIE